MRTLRVLMGVLVITLVAGCGRTNEPPRRQLAIVVQPERSLNTQALRLVVSGAVPGRDVTLALSSRDSQGQLFTARATYRANSSGVVDLAHAAAVSGSYQGVNAMGLVDTLRVGTAATSYLWGSGAQTFRLVAGQQGSALTSTSFQRRLIAPGVSVSTESLAATGFVGEFWAPSQMHSRKPGVLEFGGSEGGLDGQLVGADLADQGYPTLDIAYFDEPGLPTQLKDIPLAYFARALGWLAHRLHQHRVYVLSYSRGSEAAFLLGVHYPDLVRGVVASSPDNLSFAAYPSGNGAAWTFHGKPIPYSRTFSSSQPISDPAADIPVAKIQGPVLLDCGTDDMVWPSCAYVRNIERQFAHSRFPFPRPAFYYPKAGHYLDNLVPFQPGSASDTDDSVGNGQDALSDAVADSHLWTRVVAFIGH